MIIKLTEGFQINDSKGQALVTFAPGMSATVIRWDYIPKDSDILYPWGAYGSKFQSWGPFAPSTTTREPREDLFVIYIRGKFIAIPRDKCEIPVAIGWRFNY